MLNFVWDQERALEVRAEEALEKGLRLGRQEGLSQGVEKGLVLSLGNIMKNMGVSLDKAMDVLQIPAAERAKYAALVKG